MADFFPTVLWREKTGGTGPIGETWVIGLGSADGTCMRSLIEFTTDSGLPNGPVFWVSPDGTTGQIAWWDSTGSGAPANIRIAPFTVTSAADGSYPTISIGTVSLLTQVSNYNWGSIAGMDFSADGKCLAYFTQLLEADGTWHWELRVADVSADSSCGLAGSTTMPLGNHASNPDILPDDIFNPHWSPDGNSVFAQIVEYQSVDDRTGDWGILRIDLPGPSFAQVVPGSRTAKVEDLDVAEYDGQVLVVFEQEEEESQCTFVRVVDKDGTSPGFQAFRGGGPFWSQKGRLAEPGLPTVYHFPRDGILCGLEIMEETDPMTLSSLVTAYDPSRLFVDDVE